jgi:RNA recognition motif-containing protein
MSYFSQFGKMYNFRRMYNKDRKESGYAFFDVDQSRADKFVAKPHQIKSALVNCKVAADSTRISQVQKDEMRRKLYVSNLPPSTSDMDLLHLFEPFGKMTKAYMVRNRSDGSCKNFGFVIFQTVTDIENFLKIPRVIKFKGRKLTVKQAVDRQTQRTLKKSQPQTPCLNLSENSLLFGDDFSSTKAMILKKASLLTENPGNYRLNHAPRSQGLVNTTRRPIPRPPAHCEIPWRYQDASRDFSRFIF